MTEQEQWLKDAGVRRSVMGFGYEMHRESIVDVMQKGMQDTEFAKNFDWSTYDLRNMAIELFGFSIITADVVDRLAKHGPFLEVGAGTGYLAYELKKAGADVVAVDPEPYSGVLYLPKKLYVDVIRMTAEDAIDKFKGRTLLTSWPSLDEDWPVRAIRRFDGSKLVYIGEWRGCTANEEFHAELEEKWEVVEEMVLQQWYCIHDCCWVLERK